VLPQGAAGLLCTLALTGWITSCQSPWISPRSTPTPATAPDWATTYRGAASGVVRIDATTCAGSGVGTGFLLSPNLVATVAHVVDGAVAIDITAGNQTTAGQVQGIDPATDVALVRITSPVRGHTFSLANALPPDRAGQLREARGVRRFGPWSWQKDPLTGLP
jgi:S1-C subfamily serine protease